MTVDHYAPCPCGNGKKLKFCKCMDQPQEFEKIVKLIDGDQHLAALDRINQLLEKTPNAAWLLAIKGELTLGMQEIESFRETANRFNKLKPDNPLGLVMKSIALATDEDSKPSEVARYLLEGLAESRETVHALAVMAIRLLIQSMAVNGMMSMVGFWSEIMGALTEQPENDSPSVDPQINLLAKTPVKLVDVPAGAEWGERLAEVVSLTKTFRYAQAETKLKAILRDFPEQATPLSHLLRAQLALLDQANAHKTALQLSESLDISPEERNYFRAVAFEIEPDSKSLQTKISVNFCEVDSEDRIQQEMTALNFVDTSDGPALEDVRRYYAALVGDEVPAKRIFSVFDKDLSVDVAEGERVYSSVIATVVLYGKQTDKPVRVLCVANDLPKHREKAEQVLAALQLGAPVESDLPLNSVYGEFLNRPHLLIGDPSSQLTIEERGDRLIEDFLNMPIAALDEKTPGEAASEERLRGNLLGLLYHLEGEQNIVVRAEVIDDIYKRLKLDRPTVEFDTKDENLRLATPLDMDRIPKTELNDAQLQGLMIRAMGLGASRAFYHSAVEFRTRDSLKGQVQLQVAAMSGLLSILPSVDERIAICEELETTLAAANSPVGRIVIQRMSLLQAAGREQEARAVLQEGVQKYPEDPYLMSFIQYAMQQQGVPAPGGGGDDLAAKMMMNGAQRSPASDEGLVLPGSSDQSSSSDGDSKLWLPGQ
ncbi:MAG: hypothetical protein VXZ82_06360 [Planctomycetota bacterium]|nr:hypothetical protein [Planctomycetota bacterium]